MYDSKIKILTELKNKLVERFGNEIVNVILFGSHIEGNAHKNSDYDIVVVIKDKDADWRFKDKIRNVFYDYSIEYDMFFDILIISEYELQNTIRGAQPIFERALNQGLYL